MPNSTSRSAVAEGDTSAREVVGRQLDLHAVAGNELDVVLAHLPRDMPQNDGAVVELHAEHHVRQRLGDETVDLDRFFLRRPGSCLLLFTLGGARGHAARARAGTRSRRRARPALRSGAGSPLTGAWRSSSTWFRHSFSSVTAGEHSVITDVARTKHL